ncbi:MAG: hypothetical protein KDA28_05460 [Phycisphaerales bacterium]|nr:hypothetical protein [Phycisphaerales bacterium]
MTDVTSDETGADVDCMLRIAREMVFPEFSGDPMLVTYPIHTTTLYPPADVEDDPEAQPQSQPTSQPTSLPHDD